MTSLEGYTQDGGRRDRTGHSRNGGFWGQRGNRNRPGDRRSESSSRGDKKSDSSSVSNSDSTVPGFGVRDEPQKVPGFEVAKEEQPTVPGFGKPEKTASGKKSAAAKSSSDAKPAPHADPSAAAARLDNMIRQHAKSLLNQYDANKNGQLERDEWQNMHRKHWAADRNRNGVITLEELTDHLSQLNRPRGGNAGRGDRRPRFAPARPGGGPSSYQSTYRFRTPTERLPEGLPDWFARKDANGDGQVAMAEYASFWNRAKVREFCRQDANHDGIITAAECLEAEGEK